MTQKTIPLRVDPRLARALRRATRAASSDDASLSPTVIVREACSLWLEAHEGASGMRRRSRGARGRRRELAVDLPESLHDRLKAEAKRRYDKRSQPDSIRGIVETATEIWLRRHGHPTHWPPREG